MSGNADLAIDVVLSPFLQEKFFGAHQEEGEDLIHLSLRLVELIDAIISIDPSYRVKRQEVLKERFAACVRHDGLRREIKHLNCEQ